MPGSRGGLEDAPLVLTTQINPDEIDKEAWNFDLTEKYGVEFYEASLRNAHPKEIEHVIDDVGRRIGTELQYEKFNFTHKASNIAHGVTSSAYKTLETMKDKIDAQLALATKIRAVDASDVASKVISTHFKRILEIERDTDANETFISFAIPVTLLCLDSKDKIIFSLSVNEPIE